MVKLLLVIGPNLLLENNACEGAVGSGTLLLNEPNRNTHIINVQEEHYGKTAGTRKR